MTHKTKHILTIILHVLFWLFVAWRYITCSNLRPLALHTWKELLSMAFVMLLVYSNYFILIPKILFRNKTLAYWFIAVVSIVLCAAAEMWLMYDDILVRAHWAGPEILKVYLLDTALLVFLRYASFFAFFFILKNYSAQSKIRRTMESEILRSSCKILLRMYGNKYKLVDIRNIAYFSSAKGSTTAVMTDGTINEQYCNLSDFEANIPTNLCMRVNRNAIVVLENIRRYTDTAVQVRLRDEDRILAYYSTKQDEIMSALKCWNPSLYSDATLI